MSKFEKCKDCSLFREEGDWKAAIECYPCRGSGIKRKGQLPLCNGCGGSLIPPHEECQYGLVDAVVTGGYGSTHLLDDSAYRFSLCEGCLRKTFDSFVISPDIHWMDLDAREDCIPYSEDKAMHLQELWQRGGGPSEKFHAGICNATEGCREEAKWRVFSHAFMTHEAVCDSHKESNDTFVAADLVKCMPIASKDRSREENEYIANAWLMANVSRSLTFFPYIGEVLVDVLPVSLYKEHMNEPNYSTDHWEDDLISAMWCTDDEIDVRRFKNILGRLDLDGGFLLFGKTKDLKPFCEDTDILAK